jgi:hypothetical protein
VDPVCAELSLRNRRDRLLDIVLRKSGDLLMIFLKMERGNGVEFCMGPRFINIDHGTPPPVPSPRIGITSPTRSRGDC